MLKRYLITYTGQNNEIVHIDVIATCKEEAKEYIRYIQNLSSDVIISINEIDAEVSV